LSKFLLTINLLIVSNFFSEQFSWAVSHFLADISSKIVALADPVLSQPDMEWEMVSPPAGAYIPSYTIYDVLPDLPGRSGIRFFLVASTYKQYRAEVRGRTFLEGPAFHLYLV
jgi:hypothetical protein